MIGTTGAIGRSAGGAAGASGASCGVSAIDVEQPGPQVGRRRVGHGVGQRRGDLAQRVELGPQVRSSFECCIHVRLLLVAERADGGERQQLAQLVVGHAWTPITVRNRINPSRMRVFTVPSATPSRSAICTCVRPS